MTKQRSWICRNWFWLAWAAAAVGLVWRARFCIAGEEESYFLTQAYSYLQGWIPTAEIWGATQFSSMIFMPLAALFHGLTCPWDGVYLLLRLCYIGLECAVSAAAFFLLCRFTTRNWAAFGALLALLFTPLNLNTFSYNSLGMTLRCCSCCWRCLAHGRAAGGLPFWPGPALPWRWRPTRP